jgi:hypothetical protein
VLFARIQLRERRRATSVLQADLRAHRQVIVEYKTPVGDTGEYVLNPESEESIRRFLEEVRAESRGTAAGAR